MKILARIDGIIVISIGVIYGILALQIRYNTVTDAQIGAEIFPVIVATLLVVSGVAMILRRENADHQKIWPSARVWAQISLLTVIFLFYSFFFDTVGFLISNSILGAYLGMLLGGKLWKCSLTGVLISVAIFVLFSWTLEISLPVGPLTFIDEIMNPLEL